MQLELNLKKELARMEKMTIGQLRERYAEVFRETTNGRNRQWLIKRIAWRLQANAEGDLSERARRRAEELANDADIRSTPPRESIPVEAAKPQVTRPAPAGDDRLPMPGAVITRTYKGRDVHVTVRSDGFEFEGETYKSLSAVAKAVTGAHWNGYRFFGLQKGGAA